MKTQDKIIFLDRDGVINRFPGKGVYVVKKKQFRFLPNTFKALHLLKEEGFKVFVVSNQGCVSRGLITRLALKKMTDRMLAEIKQNGGSINRVYYCEHQTSDRCECKKPKTLLFKKALKGRKADLNKIYFIGDSEEDIQAAKNLGCRSILALSGRLKRRDIPKLLAKPDLVKKNLLDAARWITQKKS